MIFAKPTPKGLGIEIWGNCDDIEQLYNIVNDIWDIKDTNTDRDSDKIISHLSYEIRKSSYGSRLVSKQGFFPHVQTDIYYGVKFSWVYILFAIQTLRHLTRSKGTSDLIISTLLQLEFWTYTAMEQYDLQGAKKISDYIKGSQFSTIPHSYLLMRQIDEQYLKMPRTKSSFRNLRNMFKIASPYTQEYLFHQEILEETAKLHNCEISDLELKDSSEFDYDNIEW